MPRLPRLRLAMTRRRWIAAAAAATVALGGAATGATLALRSAPHPSRPAAVATPALQAPVAGESSSPTSGATASPAALTAGALLPRTLQNLDLHAAYAPVPLQFTAPTIQVDVPMTGVGLTSKNAVDAPEGPASAPIWDQAFWYRGGAEPGQPGVFAVAGHVDRVGGGAAAFAKLPQIKPGDVVSVTDTRSGAVYRYRITDARAYSLKEVGTLPVLDRIYGTDVDRGQPPHVPTDGRARISIITCTGTWLGSQYDHRFVAFGDLVDQAA